MLPVVCQASINPVTGQSTKAVSSKFVVTLDKNGSFKVGISTYKLVHKVSGQHVEFNGEKESLQDFFLKDIVLITQVDNMNYKLAKTLQQKWLDDQLTFKYGDESELDKAKYTFLSTLKSDEESKLNKAVPIREG